MDLFRSCCGDCFTITDIVVENNTRYPVFVVVSSRQILQIFNPDDLSDLDNRRQSSVYNYGDTDVAGLNDRLSVNMSPRDEVQLEKIRLEAGDVYELDGFFSTLFYVQAQCLTENGYVLVWKNKAGSIKYPIKIESTDVLRVSSIELKSKTGHFLGPPIRALVGNDQRDLESIHQAFDSQVGQEEYVVMSDGERL